MTDLSTPHSERNSLHSGYQNGGNMTNCNSMSENSYSYSYSGKNEDKMAKDLGSSFSAQLNAVQHASASSEPPSTYHATTPSPPDSVVYNPVGPLHSAKLRDDASLSNNQQRSPNKKRQRR